MRLDVRSMKYRCTLTELKFATQVRHKQISPAEVEAHRKQLWDE